MIPWILEHILSIAIFSPLLGVGVILLMSRKDQASSYEVGLVSSFLTIICTLFVFVNANEGIYSESTHWFKFIGASYFVGVDGLSSTLMLLTAISFFVFFVLSWRFIKSRVKESIAVVLMFELACLGFFASQDLVLMISFTILAILFMGFSLFFHAKTDSKFIFRYFGYMAVAIMLLLGFLVIVILGGIGTSLSALQDVRFNLSIQIILISFLFAASFIISGIFPFHGWTKNIISSCLDFKWLLYIVFSLVGLFLLYRLVPLFVLGMHSMQMIMIWIVISILLGVSIIALSQNELARMFLHVVMFYLLIPVLGIVSISSQGFNGAGFLMVSLFITVILFTIINQIVIGRKFNIDSDEFSKLLASCPVLKFVYVMFIACFAGIPLFSFFPGLFMMLTGFFNQKWVITFLYLLSLIIISLAVFKSTFKSIAIKSSDGMNQNFSACKFTLAIVCVLIVLGIGIFPDIIMYYIKSSMEVFWQQMSIQI